ncbi:MAG: type III pantothenate kinase [Oceanospirillales bacterium]|nr:MAG: type III pantothenate kinase [Oceanospirillales bacterium]
MTELELDAGNTFVKWRICRDGVAEPQQRWFTDEIRCRSVQVPNEWIGVDSARYVSVAGEEVNNWLNQTFKRLAIPFHQAKVHSEYHDLKNAYKTPEQMGADRWVAMIAAWQKMRSSFCVVDAGSAITIDWVNHQGQHLGGYILPGVAMLKKSLLGQTAQVRWDEKHHTSLIEPGKSTAECVEHGCRYQIAALMKQLERDCKDRQIDKILITGGDAVDLMAWLKEAEYHPLLVLDGLKYLDTSHLGEKVQANKQTES